MTRSTIERWRIRLEAYAEFQRKYGGDDPSLGQAVTAALAHIADLEARLADPTFTNQLTLEIYTLRATVARLTDEFASANGAVIDEQKHRERDAVAADNEIDRLRATVERLEEENERLRKSVDIAVKPWGEN